jgi:hypothetical protein
MMILIYMRGEVYVENTVCLGAFLSSDTLSGYLSRGNSGKADRLPALYP